MLGSSWVTTQFAAYQETLSFMKLVCMYMGWARNPALAPRPSMIYCAYEVSKLVYKNTFILSPCNYLFHSLWIIIIKWWNICTCLPESKCGTCITSTSRIWFCCIGRYERSVEDIWLALLLYTIVSQSKDLRKYIFERIFWSTPLGQLWWWGRSYISCVISCEANICNAKWFLFFIPSPSSSSFPPYDNTVYALLEF
jgi:hypothetical protein